MKILFACGIVFLATNLLAAEPETVKIPLDEIVGYNLPDTEDMRKMEPDWDKPIASAEQLLERSPSQRIQRLLTDRPRPKERETAFVVEGIKLKALENAESVFLLRGETGKRPEQSPGIEVSPDTEISLVFFTYAIGDSVILESVERTDNRVTVKYQLMPRTTQDVKVHLALIPLGKFSEGVGTVSIKQVPTKDTKGHPVSFKSIGYVSDSFSFMVKP